ARLLVERDQRGGLAAGRDDELVAVHQGRLAVAPAAGAAVEVLAQVLLPAEVAGGTFEANQVAVEAEGVEPVAVHRRRAAGAGVAPGVGPPRAGRRGPDFLAALLVQGEDVFGAVAVAHGEDAAAGDRRRAVAVAEAGRLPGQGRAVLGPALQQAGLVGNG